MPITQSEAVTERQVNALKDCINAKISSYSNKGTRNKKGAISAQIILVLGSVLTPIFIGWKDGHSVLLNLALISSAITTACSSLQAFFDWKELWTNYKFSKSGLGTIIAEIDYLVSLGYDKINQDDMSNFFSRYKEICAKMDESYKSLRTSENNPNEQSNKKSE
jgi:hypothetical protein